MASYLLLESDKWVESCLEGRAIQVHLAAPHLESLFDPHGVDGEGAEVTDPELGAGLHQGAVHRAHPVKGHVDLPAVLAWRTVVQV